NAPVRAGNQAHPQHQRGHGQTVFIHDKLEGTPQGLFEGRATEVVDGQEGFVVMTKYPDIIPVMKMAKHEETRERMFVVEGQRCPENTPIRQQLLCAWRPPSCLATRHTPSLFWRRTWPRRQYPCWSSKKICARGSMSWLTPRLKKSRPLNRLISKQRESHMLDCLAGTTATTRTW
ncbi:metalloendopeptidase, partial [Coemansia sp. S142-1]